MEHKEAGVSQKSKTEGVRSAQEPLSFCHVQQSLVTIDFALVRHHLTSLSSRVLSIVGDTKSRKLNICKSERIYTTVYVGRYRLRVQKCLRTQTNYEAKMVANLRSIWELPFARAKEAFTRFLSGSSSCGFKSLRCHFFLTCGLVVIRLIDLYGRPRNLA